LGLFHARKSTKSLATFIFEKWALATFVGKLVRFGVLCGACTDGFGQKKWAFGHFYLKSGQRETVAPQGFAGFVATFPLFSLISVKKKYVIYI